MNIFHRLIADQAITTFCANLTQQAVGALALDAMEWRVLEGLEAVLRVSGVNMRLKSMTTHIYQVPRYAQKIMSSESTPLLSGAVPAFQDIISLWRKNTGEAPYLAPFIEIGLAWTDRYTNRMDKTMAYAVAMC